MNRLSILLLLSLLLTVSANAAIIEPSDVSLGPSGASNYVLDLSEDKNDMTTLSKFPPDPHLTSETDTAPPTSWIVGLGLCLIFLGYKMKKKAE